MQNRLHDILANVNITSIHLDIQLGLVAASKDILIGCLCWYHIANCYLVN